MDSCVLRLLFWSFVFVRFSEVVAEGTSAMLVVVTVNAEVFPVRAVRGIVGGIAVPVVDREKVALFDIKFAAALGTDQPMDTAGTEYGSCFSPPPLPP